MKNKKIIIISIILLLILLIFIMLFVIKFNKAPENIKTEDPVDYYSAYQNVRASEGVTASDATAKYEDSMNEYYTVEGLIKSFNANVLYLVGSADDLNLMVTSNNEQEVLQEYRQNGYKYITNVLASKYKTKYSVNNEYILKTVGKYAGKKYTINDMLVVDDSDYINTYYIYGDYEGESFNFIIILDRYNSTYEIYLDNYLSDCGISRNNTSTMKTLNINQIERNDSNSFQYKNVNQQQMVKMYYNNYMDMLKTNINKAYELLDLDYKQKRVPTLDKFKTHVSSRISGQSEVTLEKYSVNKVGKDTEIVCCDNFGNYTVFKVTSVFKYTTILDSYTVAIDHYNDVYTNAEDKQKAIMCVNKFLECINNKDYDVAYSHLNSTFKENKYSTYESFVKFVKNNWYDLNKYNFENVRVQDNDYIFSGTLYYTTEQGSYDSGAISNSFVVRLNTNSNNYEISFELKSSE